MATTGSGRARLDIREAWRSSLIDVTRRKCSAVHKEKRGNNLPSTADIQSKLLMDYNC